MIFEFLLKYISYLSLNVFKIKRKLVYPILTTFHNLENIIFLFNIMDIYEKYRFLILKDNYLKIDHIDF